MTASKTNTRIASFEDDDIPDMATPYWAERIAKAAVRRGRPPQDVTKVSTTIRLDPDVLAAFKAEGPGWNTRINAVLRADMMKRDKSRTRG